MNTEPEWLHDKDGELVAFDEAAIAHLFVANVKLREALKTALPYINADPNDPDGPIAQAVAAIAYTDIAKAINT